MAKRDRGPTGFAIVDKERGWTSHDVVAKARGVFGTRRVGHSGTLDPDATGVLLLGVGRATRILRFLDGATKSYTGEIVFGTETDSLDSTGTVTRTHDMEAIDLDAARDAAASLTGEILQTPPMVSAKKVEGKRLHSLAREGIEVERKAVPVVVRRFDLTATDDPMVLRAEVDCSTGTYIRVLAADLGAAMGGGAHLRNLRRTAIGSFTDDAARPVEEASLLPPAVALRDLETLTVTDDLAVDVSHGKVLPTDLLGLVGDGPYSVLNQSGELIAVYETHAKGTVKPAVVLVDPPGSATEQPPSEEHR